MEEREAYELLVIDGQVTMKQARALGKALALNEEWLTRAKWSVVEVVWASDWLLRHQVESVNPTLTSTV